MAANQELITALAGTHPQWAAHPCAGLPQCFAEVTPGDVVLMLGLASTLAPVAGLLRGARILVIGADDDARRLRAVVRPLSLPALRHAAEQLLERAPGGSGPATFAGRVRDVELETCREALWYVADGTRGPTTHSAGTWGEAFAAHLEHFFTVKRELNRQLGGLRTGSTPLALADGDAHLAFSEGDWQALPPRMLDAVSHVYLNAGLTACTGPQGDAAASLAAVRQQLAELRAKCPEDATVSLLFSAGPAPVEAVRRAAAESGYVSTGEQLVFCDRGGGTRVPDCTLLHLLPSTAEGELTPSPEPGETVGAGAVLPFVRAAAALASDAAPEAVRRGAATLLPRRLQPGLEHLDAADAAVLCADTEAAARSYHSLCGALLRLLLERDGWELHCCRPALVADEFGLSLSPARPPEGLPEPILMAVHGKHRLHVYFDDEPVAVRRQAAAAIMARDDGRFEDLAVLIVARDAELAGHREVERAAEWSRGLFLGFEDLRRLCQQACPDSYGQLAAPPPPASTDRQRPNQAAAFDVEICGQMPVGGPDPSHYKLRFRAPRLRDVAPGQFVMIDPAACRRAQPTGPVDWPSFASAYRGGPRAYLKRPFGIHRAYLPYFPPAYLRHLQLPPHLSLILKTGFAEQFDMFYKVLDTGVGTREMTALIAGDRVQMLGPLGNSVDCTALRLEGREEIHVVGGGVGVVPLIYLVQALRFRGFRVKAFIGIERLDRLRHRDELAASYVDDPESVYIYVDDLKAMGLSQEDIFISCDQRCPADELVPPTHFHHGFISELYERHLARAPAAGGRAAFACGPMPMMRAVAAIAERRELPLQVLMEKRMACGIGVCLSCVCRTRSGGEHYARVCTEGPVFDAGDIVWDPTD